MGWIDHTGDENGDFHHLGVAFVASEAAEVPSLVVSAAHPPPPPPLHTLLLRAGSNLTQRASAYWCFDYVGMDWFWGWT